MDKFIMTVVVILLVYLCVYAIVNRVKEIDYQIKAAKAKLEASGIVTENLDIH